MAEEGVGYGVSDDEQHAGERVPSSQRQFDISPDDLIVRCILTSVFFHGIV